MAYNSTNPVFQPKFWNTIQGNDRMTLEGTLQKTGIFFGIATASAVGSVALGFIMPGLLFPMMLIGMFATMGMGFYLWFSRPAEPATFVIVYAALEGLFIGPLTLVFEIMYPGIAIQAGLSNLCCRCMYVDDLLSRHSATYTNVQQNRVYTRRVDFPCIFHQHLLRIAHAMVSSVPALIWADWHRN